MDDVQPITGYSTYIMTMADLLNLDKPQGIFGVPLRQSITYANVAISLVDEKGESYIYGYVPIVVAKCGVYLKEKGRWTALEPSSSVDERLTGISYWNRGHFSIERIREAHQRVEEYI